ncbi:putative nucleic acid-binding protein [Tamilnaduibacter salinus]|uniref:PIN domain-containing protein n=1 Tax=Tamilnaduibacter salinus TaxID=1484056 RepID=A0A2A2I7A3_9GAMM|nr:PIN domain-containing protein [Tamilnaduibacter salinus]PAV27537.1 PIN domain-containing protein [Tamilnaduibacter salinus]PVY77020.1 putative nucleic acid-binding protein [Tamilnaduibacter salinus]
MSKFTVVYDACVLYPAPLRDTLMRLALTDLFKAQWTDAIHDEWINALLRSGKHSRTTLERARDLMDRHVRDAKVHGYEVLIDCLTLPDPDDRHVLAAAIRCNANAIITFNLKDFPEEFVRPYDIDIIHPDDFILYQIDMAPALCCRAIHAQRAALTNPEYCVDDFLAILQRQQLPQTVSRLREYAGFL